MEILYIIVTDYSMFFWRCSSTDRMEVSEASDLGSIPNIATECFKSCYLLEQVTTFIRLSRLRQPRTKAPLPTYKIFTKKLKHHLHIICGFGNRLANKTYHFLNFITRKSYLCQMLNSHILLCFFKRIRIANTK